MCLGTRSIRVTLKMWESGACRCDSFTILKKAFVLLLNVPLQKPERPQRASTYVQTFGYLLAKFTWTTRHTMNFCFYHHRREVFSCFPPTQPLTQLSLGILEPSRSCWHLQG